MRVAQGQRGATTKRAGLNNARSVARRLWHSFTWFMALRLGSGRGLRRVLTFGFILSGMLACAVPLYNLFVENVQIQQILATTDPPSRNVSIQVNSNVHDGDYGIADTTIRGSAARHLTSFTGPSPLYYVLAEEMTLLRAGDGAISKPPDTPSIRLEAADYVLLAPHMKLIAGRVPQQVSTGAGAEAIVTAEMASLYHLRLGDTISAAPPEQPVNAVTVRVVGIWQPRDAQDPFWNGWAFESQGPGFPPPPRIFPVLLSYSDLFASARDYDSLRLTQNWIYFTDSQRITGDNRQAVVADIQRFRADIGTYTGLLPTVATRLDSVLSTDQALRDLVSLPLYLVTVPTLGLALLLVAMVATMLVEAQSQKIATLRTRGLSGVQLLAICAVQGLPSALLGVLAAPLCGAIAALALVWIFMPHALLAQSGVTLGYLLRLIQPRTVLGPVLLAGLLGLGVFLAAELRAARLDVLAFRREAGRSSRIPFWHQYYLDVGLLLLSALGYLDLWQFGSTDIRVELGASANSPLLFLAPSLLLLGGGLLLQRALPLVAYLGRKLAGHRRGLAVLFLSTSSVTPPAICVSPSSLR